MSTPASVCAAAVAEALESGVEAEAEVQEDVSLIALAAAPRTVGGKVLRPPVFSHVFMTSF